LHRPWRQAKNPRWDKHEEDDAAEKAANEGVRIFYPGQTCFIYKHVLKGLWGGKAQNTLLGFLSAGSTEESTYQGKIRTNKKKVNKYREKKYMEQVYLFS
jgi:hypothetical protein